MKSVVLCGSKRFEKEIRKFAKDLRKLKVDVYEPWLHKGGKEWEGLSDRYKSFVLAGLTFDHFNKLKLADACYV